MTAAPTDGELAAMVAEHVAGWKRVTRRGYDQGTLVSALDLLGDRHAGASDDIPSYATSADAVLPLLEKRDIEAQYKVGQWFIALWAYPDDNDSMERVGFGSDSTFPRAACLALLRAHGVTGI